MEMRRPRRPPTFLDIVERAPAGFWAWGENEALRAYVRRANTHYWNWDELLAHKPPEGISPETAWGHIKWARTSNRCLLDLLDDRGRAFWFGQPGSVLQELHKIDMEMGGHLGASPQSFSLEERDRHMVRSIMEEAIASSQLEGAATTRKVAKEMLRTERKPRDRSEQMILNNYRTIRWLRDHRHEPLTLDLLFEIHRRITQETLDNPSAVGRFRLPSERVWVVDDRDGETLHVPPAAEELEERVEGLCAFANSGDSEGGFMHPAIRAIVLHFMLAYNHPFVDGNGRTARALFYWHMLRSGYWLFEFLSISRIIVNAPAQYSRAFLNTEADEADLTYFIMFHLRTIQRARKELHEYLDRQRKRSREVLELYGKHPSLNHRQRSLLVRALDHAEVTFTIDTHRANFNVVYETARTDLRGLARRGFLLEYKVGRTFHYAVPEDLRGRLTGST